MKILILTCDTGEGHNSAAGATEEAFIRNGDECDVMDVLSFGGDRPRRIVSASYSSIVTKVPAVFGAMYKAGDLYSSTGITSPVYLANTLYIKNLDAYIAENHYDAVVATQLFGMEAMTAAKRRLGTKTPCFGVLTDYTCIPFLTETDIEGYFVPVDEVRLECVGKGMDESRVYTTGIPVHGRFNERLDKPAARNYLVIPRDKKMFLIMTGGLGCGNVTELCDRLLDKIDGDGNYAVYILAGRNSELKETLDDRYKNESAVHAITFTDRVNVYMNAADVLISKPGGISSTEAAVANVPLVHTMKIPGCETKNAEYFESLGMSRRGEAAEDAVRLAYELANDAEESERMRERQREHINPNAAADIAAHVHRITGA